MGRAGQRGRGFQDRTQLQPTQQVCGFLRGAVSWVGVSYKLLLCVLLLGLRTDSKGHKPRAKGRPSSRGPCSCALTQASDPEIFPEYLGIEQGEWRCGPEHPGPSVEATVPRCWAELSPPTPLAKHSVPDRAPGDALGQGPTLRKRQDGCCGCPLPEPSCTCPTHASLWNLP